MTIATELNNYAGLLEDAWDRAEEKGVDVPVNRNMENLVDAIETIRTSKDVTNGIIEQYRAVNETVEADTFVEIYDAVVATSGEEVEHPVYVSANGTRTVAAVKLDNNRVFVIRTYTNGHAYASIVTISGTNALLGSDTYIVSDGVTFDICLIGENKIFAAIAQGTRYISIICTVDGSTITRGDATVLASKESSGSTGTPSVVAVSSSTILVAHQGLNLNSYLCSIACTVSGTTVTVGTDTTLTDTRAYVHLIELASYTEGKATIVYTQNTSAPALGVMTCTISGTTITKKKTASLSSSTILTSSYVKMVSMLAISTSQIIILYTDANYDLYGVICTIGSSNDSISAGSRAKLSTLLQGSSSIVMVNSSQALILCPRKTSSGDDGYYIYGVLCEISGGKITSGKQLKLSDSMFQHITGNGSLAAQPVCATLMETNKVLSSFFADDGACREVVLDGVGETVVATSSGKIDGITKTECTTSTAGDVWVLDTSS